MGDLENQVIEDLIKNLEAEVELLKRKQSISLSQYKSDFELQHIVERSFQKAIQACADIGARIISKKAFRKAEDYHDIFNVLAEAKIISPELREGMSEMVGFRNVLVHEYRIISNEEVYRHLQDSLDIFKEFVTQMVKKESG